jgi:hypothetical protein
MTIALRDRTTSPTARPGREGRTALRSALRPTPARIVLVAAAICWLISLPSLGRAPISQYGLLAAGSPLFAVSIALSGLGLVLAARASDLLAGWAAVAMSIATMRLTITLATANPFYSWTYKHLAVADYIRETGSAARDVDIYHHWNGLFAATAWLSDITGISAITMAHWFTPVIYTLIALLFYAVARIWQCPPMIAVIATFIVQSLDWVGQGYYSPQCVAYVLALGIIGLFGWALRTGRASRPVLALILTAFVAITVTHQLTPYWVILLAFLLTITGRLRPRWLFFVMGVMAVAFLAYNWSSAAKFGLLSSGDVVSNAQTNIPLVGVRGQQVTSQIVRILSGGIWATALLCAIWSAVRKRPFLVPSILAFSSFGILFGQSYGGEAIFRVFLFSLPGCALLIAPVIERLAKLRLTVLPLIAVAMAAAVASAQGLYGAWSAYNMPEEENRISAQLMEDNPVPTYITAVAPVWPERNSARYVDFARWDPGFDATLVYVAKLVGSHFNTDVDYARFMDAVALHGATPTLLVVTQQMRVYDWYFGILPYDAIPNLEARINKDGRWKPYLLTPNVHVYEYLEAR